MFFALLELFDVAVMTAAVGYIFSDFLARFRPAKDPLLEFRGGFQWDNFWFAVKVTAPAILFHELGHKFVALGFGMQATFHAAYTWLGIGILLKLIHFPFLFFVPAFVSISGGTLIQHTITAAAGPLVNGLLWLGSSLALRSKPKRKYVNLLFLTSRINMFLFIFNFIPIPGFDGHQVFSGIWHLVSG